MTTLHMLRETDVPGWIKLAVVIALIAVIIGLTAPGGPGLGHVFALVRVRVARAAVAVLRAIARAAR